MRLYWVLWWLDVVFGVVKMVSRMVKAGQETMTPGAEATPFRNRDFIRGVGYQPRG